MNPSDSGEADQLPHEMIVRLVLDQRLIEPTGDLLAAAIDTAGPDSRCGAGRLKVSQ
jgi:hypothetical protein